MNYLSFILPPIIIVTSLALIIFVVSRKTLEIEKMIERGEELKNNDNKVVTKVKSGGLSILEKIAHWFKILSLKVHNWIEDKLTLLKKRKQKLKKLMVLMKETSIIKVKKKD